MRIFNLNGHAWRAIATALAPQASGAQSKGRKVQFSARYPIDGAVAFVMGTAQEAGRAISIVATVAGSVKLTLADDSEVTIPVSVGHTVLEWAVKKVTLAGVAGAATATASNLL